MHAVHRCSLLLQMPQAYVPVNHMQQMNAFAAARGDQVRQYTGDLASCQITSSLTSAVTQCLVWSESCPVHLIKLTRC